MLIEAEWSPTKQVHLNQALFVRAGSTKSEVLARDYRDHESDYQQSLLPLRLTAIQSVHVHITQAVLCII